MNVRELIDDLLQMDPEAQVILQKDAEGNGYSPLYCTGVGVYEPDSAWSGEFYDAEWSAEDADMSEEEWAVMLSQPRAIVLAPVN